MSAIQDRLTRIQAAQDSMNGYVRGVLDGMGLDGMWSIDLSKGEFVKEEPTNGHVPEEALSDA
jgi:hypothetical protein